MATIYTFAMIRVTNLTKQTNLKAPGQSLKSFTTLVPIISKRRQTNIDHLCLSSPSLKPAPTQTDRHTGREREREIFCKTAENLNYIYIYMYV